MNDKFIFGGLIAAVAVLLAFAALRPKPEPLGVDTAAESSASAEETAAAESDSEGTEEETDSAESDSESSEDQTAAAESDSEGTDEETAAAENGSESSDEETASAESDSEGSDEETAAAESGSEGSEEETASAESGSEGSDEETASAGSGSADSGETSADRIAALEERIAALEKQISEGSGGTSGDQSSGKDSETFGVGSTAILNDGDVRVFVSSIANDTVRFAVNGFSTQSAESGSEVELDNGCMLTVESVENKTARFTTACE